MNRWEHLQANVIFAGDYRIVRLVGQGGMGQVYEAVQLSTGIARALKLMNPDIISRDPSALRKFEQEFKLTAKIHSDHVVKVVAAGVADQTPWYAMELLEGETLDSLISRLDILPTTMVRQIVEQICHGLSAAHREGVVHRDLTPSNVFIAQSRHSGLDWTVKVLDFGIAKVVAGVYTKQTGALGTFGWAAPEQLTTGAPIGPCTDVWTLGLLAFRMLSSGSYWKADSWGAFVNEIFRESLPSASLRAAELENSASLPAGFDEWFSRCVTRDVTQRFRDAGEAYAEFSRVLPPPERPPSLAPSVPGSARPRKPSTLVTPLSGEMGSALTGSLTPHAIPVNPLLVAQRSQPPSPSTDAPVANQTLPITHYPPSAGDGLVSQKQVVIPPAPGPAPRRKHRATLPISIAAAFVVLLGTAASVAYNSAASLRARCEKLDGSIDASNAVRSFSICQRACDAKAGATCATAAALAKRFQIGENSTDEAKRLFERGCAAGIGVACRRLGALVEVVHPSEAFSLYANACSAGDLAACSQQGALLELGKGTASDLGAAKSLYDKACAGGNALGCSYRAFALAEGRGEPRNEQKLGALLDKSVAGLEEACRSDEPEACVALAATYESLGKKEMLTHVPDLVERACRAGCPTGCANQAAITILGKYGRRADPVAGLQLMDSACRNGEPTACTNIGMLKAGVGFTSRHGVRGATVFKLACSLDIHVGCAGWGPIENAPPELKESSQVAQKVMASACDAGELVACVNLGGLQCQGVGAPDCGMALQRFETACDGGNPGGCGELATLLQAGRHAPLDRARSAELFRKACDGGEIDSCVNVEWKQAEKIPALQGYCDRGSAAACVALAREFQSDPSTLAKGEELLKTVARGTKDRPYPTAFTLLGIQYLREKRTRDAFDAMNQACEQRGEAGCFYAANLLQTGGTGVPRDASKARVLVAKGCSDGDSDGCLLQAVWQLSSTDENERLRAIAVMRTLCEDGDGNACNHLGSAYTKGTAVKPDAALAAQYCQAARDRDVPDACTVSKGKRPSDCKSTREVVVACLKLSSSGCPAIGWRLKQETSLSDETRERLLHYCDNVCRLGEQGKDASSIVRSLRPECR
jgi:serine/threonine protein kinase/TPR repeat protein